MYYSCRLVIFLTLEVVQSLFLELLLYLRKIRTYDKSLDAFLIGWGKVLSFWREIIIVFFM